MSYDIWLEIDTGGPEKAVVGRDWNFTSNVSRMWRQAGADLAEHDGRTAADVTSELAAAIEELEARPEVYKTMDAPNGWGTYVQLVPALKELLEIYRAHPLASVRVSR